MNFGPLNKSLYTQTFELLEKCILFSPDKVHFALQNTANGKQSLFAFVDHIKINVSDLISKVNFNHVDLSAQDSAQHQTKSNFQTNDWGYSLYASGFGLNDTKYDPKYTALSPSEISAIKNYTGSGYYTINSFLYGKTDSLINNFDCFTFPEPSIDETAKNLLINLGFLASGLNKIDPEIQFDQPCYRGEHAVSYKEIQQRIYLIEQQDGLGKAPAFLSTSSSQSVSEGFSGGSMIKFDTAYGKDINGISYFSGENEYLINPNHIQWESWEYKNGTYYFKARIVAPLIEGADTPSQKDIDTFHALEKFAQKHQISSDFITEHNKHYYSQSGLEHTHSKTESLQLSDVFEGNVEIPGLDAANTTASSDLSQAMDLSLDLHYTPIDDNSLSSMLMGLVEVMVY